MVKINPKIDQSTRHNHLQGQSVAPAAFRHVICIYCPIAKRRTANVPIVVAQDIFQSIANCYASGIVDSRVEASLLPHSLYTKWIGRPLSTLNAQLLSFNNTEIAGLRGQFTATIEYNGRRAKFLLKKNGHLGEDNDELARNYANYNNYNKEYDDDDCWRGLELSRKLLSVRMYEKSDDVVTKPLLGFGGAGRASKDGICGRLPILRSTAAWWWLYLVSLSRGRPWQVGAAVAAAVLSNSAGGFGIDDADVEQIDAKVVTPIHCLQGEQMVKTVPFKRPIRIVAKKGPFAVGFPYKLIG
uniref:Uncharacterized protein n=1 Tax=Romanomermis culicivorax TaxID=13658 RepID=A0A915KVY4_ROMCU